MSENERLTINYKAVYVATYLKCGGVFNNDFTANLPRNLPVKKFENRLKFERIMATSLWHHFLAHPVRSEGSAPQLAPDLSGHTLPDICPPRPGYGQGFRMTVRVMVRCGAHASGASCPTSAPDGIISRRDIAIADSCRAHPVEQPPTALWDRPAGPAIRATWLGKGQRGSGRDLPDSRHRYQQQRCKDVTTPVHIFGFIHVKHNCWH